MNWPITRALGALALAAVLATSSTPTFAEPSTTTSSTTVYLTKKKVKTFVGLSRAMGMTALEKARSRPNAPKLTGQGGTPQSQQDIDKETDLTCGGEWFITWDEDVNGDPIIGTYNFHCGESSWGIG